MYGAGKIATEQMLRALHDTAGLRYVAFRPFNVYGPRMDLTGVYTEVLIRWLDAIEAGTPPLIFGDGNQSMDFVFVEDVAKANLLAAQSDINDEVFNVGTGIQTSLNELCAVVLQLMNSSLQPEHRPARAVGNVQRRRAAIEKAETMLDFRATVSLEQGLRELIRWRQATKLRGRRSCGGVMISPTLSRVIPVARPFLGRRGRKGGRRSPAEWLG